MRLEDVFFCHKNVLVGIDKTYKYVCILIYIYNYMRTYIYIIYILYIYYIYYIYIIYICACELTIRKFFWSHWMHDVKLSGSNIYSACDSLGVCRQVGTKMNRSLFILKDLVGRSPGPAIKLWRPVNGQQGSKMQHWMQNSGRPKQGSDSSDYTAATCSGNMTAAIAAKLLWVLVVGLRVTSYYTVLVQIGKLRHQALPLLQKKWCGSILHVHQTI